MKRYTKAFKALMVQRANEGEVRRDLCETYGIPTSSLANWISQANPDNKRSRPPTVAEIRSTLGMIDAGVSVEYVLEASPRAAETVRRWIEEPQYREATFEYDPSMTYDYYDLTDRSIVTHHLCTKTPSVDDRLALVAALLSPVEKPDLDEFSVPSRNATRRKYA